MKWLNILLIVFLTWCKVTAQNENYKFQNYNINHGLSLNVVTALYQDKQGFLWVGTQTGLNRFDGFDFFTLKRNIKDSTNTFSDHFIQAIYEDDENVLWLGTKSGGLNIYDKRRNEQSFITSDDTTAGFKDIKVIDQLDKDRLLIGTFGAGLYAYNKRKTRFKPIKSANGLSLQNYIHVISKDSSGIYWIGTSSGLLQFNKETGSLKEFIDVPISLAEKNLHKAIVKTLYIDYHKLWIGTDGEGLFEVDMHTKSVTQHKNPDAKENGPFHNRVWAIVKGLDNDLWIGAYAGGLSFFNLESKKFRSYQEQKESKVDIGTSITTMLKGQFGNIWIGTNVIGLHRIGQRDFNLKNFLYDKENSNSLGSDKVWRIYKDSKDRLWTANSWNGGLNLYLPEEQRFRKLRKKEGLSNDNVFSFLEDSKGNLWAGTALGLNLIDDENWSIRQLTYKNADKGQNKIWNLFEDKAGNLWVATYDGVFMYPPLDNNINNWWTKKGRSYLEGIRVWVITQDRKGNIWIGTYGNGLYVFDPVNNTWMHYEQGKNGFDISHNTISAIHEDRNGIIWIGTYGGGINKIEDYSIQVISESDGLSSNSVYALLEDNQGNLWASTSLGLSRIEKSKVINQQNEVTISNFAMNEFKINEFNQGAAFKDRDGNMYFGGIEGFMKFQPEELFINKQRPLVQFTNLTVLDKIIQPNDESAILTEAMTHTDQIDLSYNENTFAIGVVGLHFDQTEKIKYKYILEGYMESPQFEEYNKLDFLRVPSGSYTLKVSAISSSGVYSEEKSLKIVIHEPFWRQTWFYFVSITLISLLCIVYVYLRLQKVQANNKAIQQSLLAASAKKEVIQEKLKASQAKEAATQEKLRALRAQMNPHFIFNALVSIQKFIVVNDTDKATEYLIKFSNLIRGLLNSSVEGNESISLDAEVDLMHDYIDLEKTRLKHKFQYDFEYAESINPQKIKIPSMLFQPLIENAIWHGISHRADDDGTLVVQFEHFQDNLLACLISDNGVGLEVSKQKRKVEHKIHKSVGLDNIEARLASLIFDVDQQELLSIKTRKSPDGLVEGTTARILIPIIP